MSSNKLMKGLIWFAALALPLLFSGCVCLSVHPLYTADDIVFDPALLGTWALQSEAAQVQAGDEPSPALFEFSDSGAGAYTLKQSTPEGTASVFQAHLVKIGDVLFLDLVPDRSDEELNCTWLYSFQLLGMHQFFHVEQIEPELIVRELSYGWLAEQLEADPTVLEHERIEVDNGDPFYILTGPPEELQQFYVSNIGSEGAYYGVIEERTYVKVAEPEALGD